MTVPVQENQSQQPDQKISDKELNFRKQEQMYQKILAEKDARLKELEQVAHQKNQQQDDDEDDSEPYIDHKKLNKTLNKFGQSTQSEIQKAMEMAKHAAKEELKQEMWLENNPDFYDVLQHAENFAKRAPKLAETILKMPEGFERQKLVYQNIKELGLDKPASKEPTIQDKIDANKRSPYYQPSQMGTAPYGNRGDFSPTGQKSAYDQMKDLQRRLRI
jgi:hypothetical protein